MSTIDAIILASGLSKRMGRNKLLLPLGDSTVFGQFLSNFLFSLFERVIVVYHSHDVAKVCTPYPVTLCHNDHPEHGKSYSIALGLAASSPTNAVLFAAADQPLLTSTTLCQLVATYHLSSHQIVLPEVNSAPANPVIFPPELRQELLLLKGDTGGREVIRLHPELILAVPCASRQEFYDVDTPAMYEEVVRQWNQVK